MRPLIGIHRWVLALGSVAILGLAGCGAQTASAPSTTAPAKPSAAAVQAALVKRVDTYFANQGKDQSYQLTTTALYNALKTDPTKYFVVDVRMPSGTAQAPGYVQGHIGGAINIPFPDLAKHLNELPKDKPIVTVCYTGHWASQSAAVLRLLGYDAYALHFSMSDWNQQDDMLPAKAAIPNYPMVTGTAPGTFAP